MRPIKILFLAANPVTTARLALDEEIREIQRRLRGGEHGNRFVLCAEWALRAEDLPTAVMRHRPDIVHFSSHGSQVGELYLSAAEGESASVSAETLARLFALLGEGICCVVLNACYSQVQATAISTSIPAVIGMSRAIPDKAAIAFAAGFYEALAFGKSVRAAFEVACLQIELAQQETEREVPQLRLKDGVTGTEPIFGESTQRSPAEPATPVPPSAQRTRMLAMVGVIVTVLLSTCIAAGWALLKRNGEHSAVGSAQKPASAEPPPPPLAAQPLRIGSGNEIQAQHGSHVRAGIIGAKEVALPTGSGPPPQVGSGNHIEAAPGSTVETGIILGQPSAARRK